MTPELEGKEAATAFRHQHRLGVQPLGDLVALIEQTTGHDVAVLDADPDEHGLTVCDPERGVTFIGVARTRNAMRQRSTLAHELAHVMFDDRSDGRNFSDRSPEEMRADAFARNLLVPENGLKDVLRNRESLSEADLSKVVQWFVVSPAIATIAIHACGYIDATVKREWMKCTTFQLATRFGWSDQYQSLRNESDRTRSPQQLLARAISGYKEGVVSVQALATLRGMSAQVVGEELVEAGIVPHTPSMPWVTAADLPPVAVDLSDLETEPPRDGSE